MNKLDLMTICKLRDQFVFRPNERQDIVDKLGFVIWNHLIFAQRLESLVPYGSPVYEEYIQLVEKIPVPLSSAS